MIALVPPALLALVQFGAGRAALVVAGYVVINFIVDMSSSRGSSARVST